MKQLFLFLLAVAAVSCKKDNQEDFGKPTASPSEKKVSGQELFESKGNCAACHKTDQKTVGPSLAEIGKIYKAKNASMVLFLKEENEPIVDPSQYEVMKTNLAITKSMTDEELKALEDYILSFSN